jgi:hypothetical protein
MPCWRGARRGEQGTRRPVALHPCWHLEPPAAGQCPLGHRSRCRNATRLLARPVSNTGHPTRHRRDYCPIRRRVPPPAWRTTRTAPTPPRRTSGRWLRSSGVVGHVWTGWPLAVSSRQRFSMAATARSPPSRGSRAAASGVARPRRSARWPPGPLHDSAPSADRIVCRGRAGEHIAPPRASVSDGRQPTEREEAAAVDGPATSQGGGGIRIASSRSSRRTRASALPLVPVWPGTPCGCPQACEAAPCPWRRKAPLLRSHSCGSWRDRPRPPRAAIASGG